MMYFPGLFICVNSRNKALKALAGMDRSNYHHEETKMHNVILTKQFLLTFSHPHHNVSYFTSSGRFGS